MKWLFIIFLLLNVCYFGWELDKQTRIEVSNTVRPFNVPADAQILELLGESARNSETTNSALPFTSGENANEINERVTDQFTNIEDSPLQNIASMMDQGNVMIAKKFIDELVNSHPEAAINYDRKTEQEKLLCVSFGPFAGSNQAIELSNWLKGNEIQTRQRTEGDTKDQHFWIYLSPSDSKDDAMAAIEDLKGKGIQDYKLINKGNLQNAISLGLFSSQAAVNRRLNELKNIGYQPIMVPYHKAELIIWVDAKLEVKDDSEEHILTEFINGYPSRFNSIPVKCEDLFIT
jgi:hypothetical protein